MLCPFLVHRFGDSFSLDANKLPRTWTAKDNISEISQAARLAGSEVLAQLAILQSEGESPAAQEVEKAIRAMAKKDLQEGIGGSSKARSESLDGAFSVIGIVEWPNLPTNRVLISPQEVRSVWRRFMSDTKMQITQVRLIIATWTSILLQQYSVYTLLNRLEAVLNGIC